MFDGKLVFLATWQMLGAVVKELLMGALGGLVGMGGCYFM